MPSHYTLANQTHDKGRNLVRHRTSKAKVSTANGIESRGI